MGILLFYISLFISEVKWMLAVQFVRRFFANTCPMINNSCMDSFRRYRERVHNICDGILRDDARARELCDSATNISIERSWMKTRVRVTDHHNSRTTTNISLPLIWRSQGGYCKKTHFSHKGKHLQCCKKHTIFSSVSSLLSNVLVSHLDKKMYSVGFINNWMERINLVYR